VSSAIDRGALTTLLAHPKDLRQFDGELELVEQNTIRGWAIDRNLPDEPIEVDIFVDEEIVSVIPADEPRPDLNEKGLAGHGFSYTIPDRWNDGKSHVVRIQPSGSSNVLRGSPRTIMLGRP
jgi:hypothetical protein